MNEISSGVDTPAPFDAKIAARLSTHTHRDTQRRSESHRIIHITYISHIDSTDLDLSTLAPPREMHGISIVS